MSADSPAWAAELSLASDKMMRKIAGIVADESIKKVRVQSRARAGDEAGEIAPKGPDKGNEPEELRGKLGDNADHPIFIFNVRGQGYHFREP